MVYLQGTVVRFDVEVGVAVLPRDPRAPMVRDEEDAEFTLHARQVMTVYSGRVLLEGADGADAIDLCLPLYVGFGTEGGAAAVHRPGLPMGAPRRLGINELLLHYDADDDMIIQCK